LPEETIGRMVGDGASVLVQRALRTAGLEPTPQSLADFLDIYESRLLIHTRVYDGMVAALEELRRLGPAAVLTNKPLAASRRILDELGLSPYFSEVIGGDGEFPRKPSPESLLYLAQCHRASPAETTLIGDSRIDWETASHASARICLARYGFGYEGFPTERLTGLELAVDAPSELPDVLTRALLRER
jgi:phosphoglycolate phosphatase